MKRVWHSKILQKSNNKKVWLNIIEKKKESERKNKINFKTQNVVAFF